MTTYYDKVMKKIKHNDNIPVIVKQDVLKRCNDWLEMNHSDKNSNYIYRQLQYLKEWEDI